MAPVTRHPTATASPPARCAVALKEWSGICAALASGRQTILLRKGGIAEESGRFVPEHPAFWLYPTAMHQGQQGLRVAIEGPPGAGGPGTEVGLSALAVVAVVGYLDRPESLDGLEDLHVWTAATIRRRFEYRRPGLWVLGVRAFVLPEPWPIAVTADQVGCRSWVSLESPPPTPPLAPAPVDPPFEDQMRRLREVLAEGQPGRDTPHDAE